MSICSNFRRTLGIVLCAVLWTGVAQATPTSVTLSGLTNWYGTSTTNNASEPGRIATGDIDCDGAKDIVMSAPDYAIGKGRIYVKLGSSGFSGTSSLSSTYMEVAITGVTKGDYLGRAVLAHDVDGDGCDDIIALSDDSASTFEKIHVIYGDSSWSAGFNDTLSMVSSYDTLSHTVNGGDSKLHLLGAIDGDVNADGTTNSDDNFVAACFISSVECYLIPIQNLNDSTDFETAALYRISGYASVYDNIMSADMNHDENQDLIFSDYSEGGAFEDSVTIIYGPVSDSSSILTDVSSTPNNYFESMSVSGEDVAIVDTVAGVEGFGGVTRIGMLFGTDYPDLIVGAFYDDCGSYSDSGRYHIISGDSLNNLRDSISATTGITIYNDTSTGTYNYSDVDVVLFGSDQSNSFIGRAYNSSSADVNGDGIDDMVLGGNLYYSPNETGTSHIIYGGALDSLVGTEVQIGAAYSNSDYYMAGAASNDELATNVLADDLDGDGLDDLIITATGASSGGGTVYLWPGAVTDIDADGVDSAADIDSDGVYESLDCNDKDAAIESNTWYEDSDGDGYGDATSTLTACNQPTGYVSAGTDCNDSNAAIHPTASESCDSVDNDCDGSTDEGVTTTYYRDADSDSYGNLTVTTSACSAPAGYVTNSTDCNDSSAAAYPGASETCDSVDNDCDGSTDEGVTTTYYRDADSDTYGNLTVTTSACSAPAGYVTNSLDCNDSSSSIKPGASESCDSVDNDCDGSTDEGVTSTYYRDSDSDTYGNLSVTTSACSAPAGYVTNSTDCNDSSASVNPGATESCDSVDNDCDGSTDEGVTTTYYRDSDSDTYGNFSVTTTACSVPAGYVTNSTDCNDSVSSTHPGATESCDSVDNDCDGSTDEGVTTTYYRDSDSDTYGNISVTTSACSAPAGYVSNDDDCNDSSAAINPAATESAAMCGDGIDQNCDGSDLSCTAADADGDGFTPAGGDCDDTRASINPSAVESCDGFDNDCDGSTDEGVTTTYYQDADSDGYGNLSVSTTACSVPPGYVTNSADCDDSAATTFPGATETCDSEDNDCDGSTDEGVTSTYYRDSDADGFGNAGYSTSACSAVAGYVSDSSDCNDGNASINPSAAEVCDTVDNDCDGTSDNDDAVDANIFYLDADLDGYGVASSSTTSCSASVTGYASNDDDCNDGSSSISPAVTESIAMCDDGVDQNCDGSDLSCTASDADGDGYTPAAGDCDDTRSTVNPGATETCDGLDNNCDGSDDEGVTTTYYLDADVDGYGDVTSTIAACSLPEGYVSNSTDCDDSSSSTSPVATEICDGIDNNCDGATDEDVELTFYRDRDSDGFGDISTTTIDCSAPTGYVSNSTDCNDSSAYVNPSVSEICDGQDNDCDGTSDNDDAIDANTFYLDDDSDGYGDASNITTSCDSSVAGYASNDDDCNDSSASINPAASETMAMCGDGIDQNCDGSDLSCTAAGADGDGYTAAGGDCDDTRSNINPGETEICDSFDNNCDGSTDDSSAADALIYYLDADSDNYGDPLNTQAACSLPAGYVENNLDCDDSVSAVNPLATEICGDGVDNNCDTIDTECEGPDETDADLDGVSLESGDCDDADETVYPGAVELGDAIDNDCDGSTDEGLFKVVVSKMDSEVRPGNNFSMTLDMTNSSGIELVDIDVLISDDPINPVTSSSGVVNIAVLKPFANCTSTIECEELLSFAALQSNNSETTQRVLSVAMPNGKTTGNYHVEVQVRSRSTGELIAKSATLYGVFSWRSLGVPMLSSKSRIKVK